MTDAERTIWNAAVTQYVATLSRKDATFDEPLPALGLALAAAAYRSTLAGVSVDAATRSVLENAAPVYRKAWRSSMESLVQQHGASVVALLTRAYELSWPSAGHPVHVSAYANWGGDGRTDRETALVALMARAGVKPDP